ncbi:MAG TPA: ammonium transporter [Candidatus Methylomirabilis sp.]|nr:ammonium transporter [Candidatus Methylomirabilis sp.]
MGGYRLLRLLVTFGLLTALCLLAVPLAAQQPAPAPAAPPATAPAATTQAAPPPKIDSGDTAWMLVSSALVLMMTAPGLALFYGGMVRRQNALGTIMHSFIIMAVVSLQWVLWGYSLSFGPDVHGLVGNLSWIGLNGVDLTPNPDYAATIPHQAFMIYQLMFAIITPALITGAFAERMKFSAFLVFTLLWTTFIYDPLAHWVWGTGGWLRNLGALDFAGGTVVHVSSGISALAAALLIGKRRGFGSEPMPPHNLPLTVTGAAMLWVGWFGFNAGSALSSGALATSAFVVTHVATAAAAVSWMLVEWLSRGRPTVLGAASGAVAGLVAITPASGFVGPLSAIIIGAVAGYLCYSACNLKTRLGYDDSLDVVGVHGVGGTWGALATGLFASKAINDAGNNGLFFGNPGQLWVQVVGVLATWIFAFIGSLILLKIVDVLIGLRVDEEDEVMGLDLSQHNENAYSLGLIGTAGQGTGFGTAEYRSVLGHGAASPTSSKAATH